MAPQTLRSSPSNYLPLPTLIIHHIIGFPPKKKKKPATPQPTSPTQSPRSETYGAAKFNIVEAIILYIYPKEWTGSIIPSLWPERSIRCPRSESGARESWWFEGVFWKILDVIFVHDRLGGFSSPVSWVLVDMLQDAGAHDGLQAPSHVPEFVSVEITSPL